MQKFDRLADAVVRGGTVDGIKVIATTNKDLIGQIEEAQVAHDRLDKHGRELMAQHRTTLQSGAVKLAESEIRAREEMEGADAARNEILKMMEDAEKMAGNEMDAAMISADAAHRLANRMILALTVVGIILASGIDVVNQDETGQLLTAMKNMVEKLRSVVADVKTAADNVASGSQQLSSGSEQMSQGTTEQAASAEEASSSVEEMNATIRQNADNASQTEKIALKSAQDARESGNAVAEAVNAMKDIASKISIIEEIGDSWGRKE